MDKPAAFSATYSDLSARLEAAAIPVPECGCLIWLGALSAGRYGTITLNGRQVKAHRASWIARYGEIPTGVHVLHRCDTPQCINPDHLFLGTPLENARDREAKGRGNHAFGASNGRHTVPQSTCRGDSHYTRQVPLLKAGESNGRSVLSESDIHEIRNWIGSQSTAAAHFGVSKTTIGKIQRGQLWKHI